MIHRSIKNYSEIGVSVKKWLTNFTGGADQRDEFAAALTDSAATGSTLVIDCPIKIDATGGREIYVPNNLKVAFEGTGIIYAMWDTTPLFIALHSNFEFSNLDVMYSGPGLDASINYNNSPGNNAAFSAHGRLQTKMQTDFGNTFSGSGRPVWYGPHAFMSCFYMMGKAFGKFTGETKFRVPANATADKFIPWVIAGKGQWIPGLTGITSNTGTLTPNVNIVQPKLHIDNLMIDGACMGIQGEFSLVEIQRTRSYRYSDLMAVDGTLIGGVAGNGTPPPHLFYFNERCNHININDTLDYGTWVTNNADPKARRSSASGSCCSLKVTAQRGIISGYKSYRPDGFADMLGDQSGFGQSAYTLEDFYAEYDSTVCGNAFPCIRFPASPYIGTSIRSGKLVDTATQSSIFPLGSSSDSANRRITVSDVECVVNDYIGTGFPGPYFNGSGHDIELTSILKAHTQTQTYRGSIAYQGSTSSQVANTSHKMKVIGWRNIAANVTELRNRTVMNGGSSGTNPNSNYAELNDITNGHTVVQTSGVKTEKWVQKALIVPVSGNSSTTTSLIIPAGWSVVQVASGPRVALGTTNGLTGYSIGWSGGAVDGLGTVSGVLPSSRLYLTDLPIVSSGSQRTITINALDGTFDGTGTIELIVTCALVSIGE